MLVHYRRSLFILFSIFFVVITPFLVIYSLGFDPNFETQKLSNTLNINIETLPRGAEVSGEKTGKWSTPIELKAMDNQTIGLNVQADNYLPEKFLFWGREGQNTTAKVTNLVLLPKNADITSDFNPNKALAFLSSNRILFYENEDLYLQIFSFGGLQGRKEEIKTTTERLIEPGHWEVLSEKSFWSPSQNFLLVKLDSGWNLFDLNSLPIQSLSLAHNFDNQAIILDREKQLWLLNLETRDLNFLVEGIDGLDSSNSPDSIWFWQKEKIFRISKGLVDTENFSISDKLYSENEMLLKIDRTPNTFRDFEVASLFQGLLVKIKDNAFYIPDFNKDMENWQVLTTNLQTFGVDTNTFFWLDKSNNLFSYNFLLKNQETLGRLELVGDPLDYRIHYYYNWRRLMVYSANQTYSVWYDKEILNKSILKYYPNLWIENSMCMAKIIDRFQFCIKDNKLQGYRNTALW